MEIASQERARRDEGSASNRNSLSLCNYFLPNSIFFSLLLLRLAVFAAQHYKFMNEMGNEMKLERRAREHRAWDKDFVFSSVDVELSLSD